MTVILGSAYGKIQIDLSGIKRGVTEAVGQLSTFEANTKRIGQQLKSAGDTMTAAITLPLVAVGVASGKAAMEFENSMQQIVGLVGKSQAQVNAWSQDLIAMGPELGRAPNELAKALYQVTSSGIASEQALGVVTEAATAASAGLGDTAVVADAVTSTMNAYRTTNMTAAQATDILVAAVREGKGEAADIAPALGRVVPIAAQLGISFDQVAAAMAGMTLVGFDASEATTNISGIMSALLKPSKQAAEVLAQFGLSGEQLRTMAAQPNGLLDVLALLRDTVGQDDEALAKIFPNIRGFRGMLSLVGTNAEQVSGIFGRLANTTGDADRAFAAVAQTAKFQFNQAMSGLQSALIQFGNAILPVIIPMLKSLAEAIQNVAKWFTTLDTGTQQTIVTVLALTAALGPVLSIGGRLIGLLGTLYGALQGVGSAVGSAVSSVIYFVQTMRLATSVGEALKFALSSVAVQVGLLVAGLVVVIKFFDAASRAAKATNEELIKMAHSDTGNVIEDAFSRAGAAFELMVNGSKRLKEVFIAHQDEMQQKLFAGEITLEQYNTEIERSAKEARLWSEGIDGVAGPVQRVDGAVRLLTQDEIALRRAQAGATEGTYGWNGALDESNRAASRTSVAVKGTSDALQAETDKALKDAEAIKKADAAAAAFDETLNSLKALIDGEVGPATQEYTSKNADLLKKESELRAELEKLQGTQGRAVKSQKASTLTANELTAAQAKQASIMEDLTNKTRKKNESDADFASRMAGLQVQYDKLTTKIGGVSGATTAWVDNSKRISEIKGELSGLTTELSLNAAAYDERLKRILFDLITEQLANSTNKEVAARAMTAMAEKLGLIDSSTAEMSRGVIAATKQLAEDQNIQKFVDTATGLLDKAKTDAAKTAADIVGPIGTAYADAALAAQTHAGAIGMATTTMSTTVKTQAEEARTKFGTMTASFVTDATTISTSAQTMATNTKTAVGNMQSVLAQYGPTIGAPLKTGFETLNNDVIKVLNAIIAKVGEVISAMTGIHVPNIQIPAGGGSGSGSGSGGGSGGGGGGGGGTCFLPGTMITMANGRHKPIEDVAIGDRVQAFEPSTGALGEGVVTGLQTHLVDQYRMLRITTGESALVTGEHPVYVGEGHAGEYVHDGFVRVADLRPGDRVLTRKGWGIVAENVAIRGQTPVYNFEVSPQHTYIASGIVVHNIKAESARARGGPVYPGMRYRVNESSMTRPEILVPSQPGYVLTRQDAMAALGQRMNDEGGRRNGDTTIYNNVFQDALATKMYLEQTRQAKIMRLSKQMSAGG